jgi:hypothetical protein
MSELSFFAFCITVIAITAISSDRDKIAEKALSALNHAAGDFATLLGKIIGHIKISYSMDKGETSKKSSEET